MGNNTEGPAMISIRNRGISNQISYGACEIQGWRKTMEDATIAHLNYENNSSIFGICDGHGGPIISQFVASNFLSLMTNMKSYKNNKTEDALIETFLKFDELLKTEKVNIFLHNYQNKHIKQKELLKCSFLPTTEFVPENKADFKESYYFGECSGLNTSIDVNINSKLDEHHKLNENIIKSSSLQDLHSNPSTASNSINLNETSHEEPLYNIQELIENSKKKPKGNIVVNKYHKHDDCIASDMGTTANILLIKDRWIYLSNVGDSLSVMYKKGKAIRLNKEHNLALKSEYERVVKSKAAIMKKRIEGRLNLSRAIGDLEFKRNSFLKFYEQAVIACPEITKVKLTDDIEFIIMACDGVWNSIEPQKLCDLVSSRLHTDHSLDFIIEEVFKEIIPKTKKTTVGKDNMSCVIVQFI